MWYRSIILYTITLFLFLFLIAIYSDRDKSSDLLYDFTRKTGQDLSLYVLDDISYYITYAYVCMCVHFSWSLVLQPYMVVLATGNWICHERIIYTSLRIIYAQTSKAARRDLTRRPRDLSASVRRNEDVRLTSLSL